MTIQRINPDTMHKNPAFTQVATVTNPSKWIFVGGQNGVDATGKVVGKDIGSQTEQAYKNVITALEAAGATLNDVFKMTIYLVEGQSLQAGFAAVQKVHQTQPQPVAPPTVSMMMVAGLANPDYLIEIEAVAVV
ncbi:MAG: RidA family protein [Chloroflexota bacterium]